MFIFLPVYSPAKTKVAEDMNIMAVIKIITFFMTHSFLLGGYIGPFILRVLRGGVDISAVTLARFFSAHIWIIPVILGLVIGLHMYLVIRLGISAIPDEED